MNISNCINGMLEYKESLGFSKDTYEYFLKDFCKYFIENGYSQLNQITHPVREAFLVLSTAVASTAFFIYYKTHPKQRKTLRMTA